MACAAGAVLIISAPSLNLSEDVRMILELAIRSTQPCCSNSENTLPEITVNIDGCNSSEYVTELICQSVGART